MIRRLTVARADRRRRGAKRRHLVAAGALAAAATITGPTVVEALPTRCSVIVSRDISPDAASARCEDTWQAGDRMRFTMVCRNGWGQTITVTSGTATNKHTVVTAWCTGAYGIAVSTNLIRWNIA